MDPALPRADIGVFGGSGLYELLDRADEVTLGTAWGAPSAPLTIGEVDGLRVAFLPRHGRAHEYPPHRVNYRANVDAMRQLGVRTLLAPFAAGSLRADLRPGELVVVDQLVDRTSGRAETFHDHFHDGPCHVSLADPYDATSRQAVLDAGRDLGLPLHDRGTVVVVNGPRFSTRAESAWFRAMGCDLVNMTQQPEAALAREAGIAYAGIALVTDYDAGIADDPGVAPVTQAEVFACFERNLAHVRELLHATVRLMGATPVASPASGSGSAASAAPVGR
jgi:5'-methylthioadenosine phosphorylase